MRTKLNTEIKWNKMLRDKIKKKNQLIKTIKAKQITTKRIRIKIDMNTNW